MTASFCSGAVREPERAAGKRSRGTEEDKQPEEGGALPERGLDGRECGDRHGSAETGADEESPRMAVGEAAREKLPGR